MMSKRAQPEPSVTEQVYRPSVPPAQATDSPFLSTPADVKVLVAKLLEERDASVLAVTHSSFKAAVGRAVSEQVATKFAAFQARRAVFNGTGFLNLNVFHDLALEFCMPVSQVILLVPSREGWLLERDELRCLCSQAFERVTAMGTNKLCVAFIEKFIQGMDTYVPSRSDGNKIPFEKVLGLACANFRRLVDGRTHHPWSVVRVCIDMISDELVVALKIPRNSTKAPKADPFGWFRLYWELAPWIGQWWLDATDSDELMKDEVPDLLSKLPMVEYYVRRTYGPDYNPFGDAAPQLPILHKACYWDALMRLYPACPTVCNGFWTTFLDPLLDSNVATYENYEVLNAYMCARLDCDREFYPLSNGASEIEWPEYCYSYHSWNYLVLHWPTSFSFLKTFHDITGPHLDVTPASWPEMKPTRDPTLFIRHDAYGFLNVQQTWSFAIENNPLSTHAAYLEAALDPASEHYAFIEEAFIRPAAREIMLYVREHPLDEVYPEPDVGRSNIGTHSLVSHLPPYYLGRVARLLQHRIPPYHYEAIMLKFNIFMYEAFAHNAFTSIAHVEQRLVPQGLSHPPRLLETFVFNTPAIEAEFLSYTNPDVVLGRVKDLRDRERRILVHEYPAVFRAFLDLENRADGRYAVLQDDPVAWPFSVPLSLALHHTASEHYDIPVKYLRDCIPLADSIPIHLEALKQFGAAFLQMLGNPSNIAPSMFPAVPTHFSNLRDAREGLEQVFAMLDRYDAVVTPVISFGRFVADGIDVLGSLLGPLNPWSDDWPLVSYFMQHMVSEFLRMPDFPLYGTGVSLFQVAPWIGRWYPSERYRRDRMDSVHTCRIVTNIADKQFYNQVTSKGRDWLLLLTATFLYPESRYLCSFVENTPFKENSELNARLRQIVNTAFNKQDLEAISFVRPAFSANLEYNILAVFRGSFRHLLRLITKNDTRDLPLLTVAPFPTNAEADIGDIPLGWRVCVFGDKPTPLFPSLYQRSLEEAVAATLAFCRSKPLYDVFYRPRATYAITTMHREKFFESSVILEVEFLPLLLAECADHFIPLLFPHGCMGWVEKMAKVSLAGHTWAEFIAALKSQVRLTDRIFTWLQEQ